MEPAIETRDLTVRYPTGGGIESISLRVERGEVMGFLGKNGAGKTTTIRVLLDLLRPDAGAARVLGCDVQDGGGALRERIGYLPGDLALPPGCTGAQSLDLLAKLQRRPPVDRDLVLDRLGFPRPALHRAARGYSTGMRQMIGITQAFQHHPELLILDEPTGGLDPVVRDAFLALVRDARRGGQTVFLSSHVLDEVERGADRVAIVHEGRLRHVGSVSELRRRSPRTATLLWRDGTKTTLAPPPDGDGTIGTTGTIASGRPSAAIERLLARAHAAAAARPGELLDLQITSPGLDELFRDVIATPLNRASTS